MYPVTPEITPSVEMSQLDELISTVAELLPRVVTPIDVRLVNAPLPGLTAPIDVKLDAPSPAMFQLASVRERLAAVVPIPIDPE